MGSYKWSYKSLNIITIVTLLISPLITPHEPPSEHSATKAISRCTTRRSSVNPPQRSWVPLCFNGRGVPGGSWVVKGGVTSPLIWVRTIVTLLISPLITTHAPPSRTSVSFSFGPKRGLQAS